MAASRPRHQGLPDEIVEDIFARMPAKSVLRCRCLSRAWAATLSSHAFVDRHFDLANRRHREVPRLCFLPGSAAESTVYAWSPPAELGNGKQQSVFTPLMAVPHNSRNGRLHGATRTCRGVLLLRSTEARTYFLCNPSMGQMVVLPDGRMAGRRCPGSDYASFGLGYDVRSRSHKVVRLLYHDARPAGLRHLRRREELAGCLCLVSSPHCRKSSLESIDIWLLTGYATGSWEKHWHIDLTKLPRQLPQPEVDDDDDDDDFMFTGVTPLALLDGSRRILFVSTKYQVAAYCLATGALEELVPAGFRGHGGIGVLHRLLVPYEESLVPTSRPFQDILWSPLSARALSIALRRLPARTLGHLKLVCRRWRAMLETDRFATLHNACARAAATSPVPVAFLAHFGATTPPDVPAELLTGPDVVSLESCSGDPGRRGNPPLSMARVVCRAPCHGLVLLSRKNGRCHALCNPVTQAMRVFVFPDDHGHGCAGLGYDTSREEHVVVRLSYTSRCLETRAYAMECRVWPERDLYPRTLDGAQPPIPAAVDVPPVHVGGTMYWPRDLRLGTAAAELAILAFNVCAETFEVVPAPPSLVGGVDSGDCRMVLAELAGKLCAVNLSASMETMTVWAKDVEGWRREHVLELQRWPEFSPRTTTELMPMAVDPIDGRILLDTGKALGYYDMRNGNLQTVYSLKTHLDYRYHSQSDDMFFIATVCEDSLFRPSHRKYMLW